ncbi:hypothetical protein PCH_Pc06g01470 [Penicillium rubens Wisconsin 54-1255]|uniref:Uncharacterized protein n=1 Tax=Penicillium rubens (strain ATCC 28089 / DSM 1075 / NRRL 1951 / Wisconsin 54-1255) TaxID=500485 RepID=B6GW85_PENRW|nr:hypothetical protein PCH_Pc06g01470 [Penicillium rubens Wisconsin 54-1255]
MERTVNRTSSVHWTVSFAICHADSPPLWSMSRTKGRRFLKWGSLSYFTLWPQIMRWTLPPSPNATSFSPLEEIQDPYGVKARGSDRPGDREIKHHEHQTSCSETSVRRHSEWLTLDRAEPPDRESGGSDFRVYKKETWDGGTGRTRTN